MARRRWRVEVFNTCRCNFLRMGLLAKMLEVVVKQTNSMQVFVLKGHLLADDVK